MTIPHDHELATLRALLELRTRERDAARAEAIEEAARVCEAKARNELAAHGPADCGYWAERCADAIRALLNTPGGGDHG